MRHWAMPAPCNGRAGDGVQGRDLMADTTLPAALPTPALAPNRHASADRARLACAEVRGGNHPIYDVVELPGLRGVLYSNPCAGARGGDVHYLSVCGSGLLA